MLSSADWLPRPQKTLEGHASVGKLRASIYNAMPLEGCQALAAFMREFQAKHDRA